MKRPRMRLAIMLNAVVAWLVRPYRSELVNTLAEVRHEQRVLSLERAHRYEVANDISRHP